MTSLTLVRRIRARPQIVFDAVTTSDGIAQWWGPDAGPVLLAEVDARLGGRYRVRFRRLLDGAEYESSGEFLKIVPPELLVMSWRWRDGVPDPGESQVQFTLKAVPEGTELTFIHSQLRDEEARLSHEAGWAGAFDKLVAHFAGGAAADSLRRRHHQSEG